MLYEGFSVAGDAFAQWAADVMLEGTFRFLSGYSSNSVWTARQVLKVTSPHFSTESFQKLEKVIIDLRFSWEKQHQSWYSFNLLSAMDETRLSELGRRRLGELHRVFKMDQPPEPEGVTAGWIGPPIPEESAQHMTDHQWLKAMAKHSQERSDWNTFTGGAREQAHVLMDHVVKDPVRFARLAFRFTGETHPEYANAILRGFGDAEPPTDASPIFEAIRHIASLALRSNDRWVGWALRRYLKADIPEDIVALVIDRAINAQDPVGSSSNVRTANVFASGINTARGQSAEVLGDLLVYDIDGSRTRMVLPVLNRMAEDPSIAVRACVAHVIAACLRHARPQALEAFAHLIQADDLLFSTPTVERLMVYIGYSDPMVIEPIIHRMLGSSVVETREVGGRLAAFAGMEWGFANLLDTVLNSDDVASRKGVAGVCAHRLSRTSDATVTRAVLKRCVNDADDGVRQASAKIASAVRSERLRPFNEPLSDLIESAAFPHALPQLLITLERAPDRVDDLVLKCARRFVDVYGTDTGDIQTRAAGDARHVGELLLRAYAQATSGIARSDVLDLLDQLFVVGAYGIAELVEASERK